MIIELRGIDFVNKGGELMLQAILCKIKAHIPGAVLVMKHSNATQRHKLLKYGMYTKTDFKIYRVPLKYIFAFIPVILRRRWHYINEKEINVVLDVSGFAFGDVWGIKKASIRLGDHIAKWKNAGKKIILMPQAFGPFTNPGLKQVMRTIIRYSDLIFARDPISLNYLEKIDGANKKIILAPDFTNLINGTVPPYFDSSECDVALIVNVKMVEATTNNSAQAYYSLIRRMITFFKKLGYRPYFLIHEENRDRTLAETINESLVNKIPILQEDNPVHLKGIIGKSKAVFTSRFHALVSALSQAVPCLATGWSHKYEMLLKEYNYTEGLLDVHCDDDLLLSKIESVLNKFSRYSIIEKLTYGMEQQQQRSEEMWRKVFNEICY